MTENSPFSDKSYFGGAVPPEIEELLGEAAAHFADTERALSCLRLALSRKPDSLAVYFSMYKFLFYKNRLGEAEEVVRQALKEAARQGKFQDDPHALLSGILPKQFSDPASPHYFYLFSLKALSFILLRQGKMEESKTLLDVLKTLDPSDRTGASVIRDYACGAMSA